MPKIDFLGKGEVYSHHLSVPYHALEIDKAKSVGKADLDGNLIIKGDNLHALKTLLPRYEGKVQCVYIDPPYNTGNDDSTGKKGWCFNDKMNSPVIKHWLNKVVDREDQCRHDKWLCMMWPRLNLLKDLLSNDGVIFISIDDHEQHRLRAIMDEIFGEDNFVGCIAWKKTSGDNKPSFAFTHDNILIYGKATNNIPRQKLNPRQLEKYKNPDNDSRGLWAKSDYRSKWTRAERPNLYYAITNPNTGEVIYPDTYSNSTKVWRHSKETHLENERHGIVWWGKDRKSREPKKKRFLSSHEGANIRSVWLDAGFNDDASRELDQIFADMRDAFPNPKPVSLIKRLMSIPQRSGGVYLDSFAGSGTTAQAVLELNKEDGGNRQFILVECEDNIAEPITAERVRRVIKGVKGAKSDALREGLGGSFAFATLGEAIDLDKMLSGESMPSWEALARYVFWLAANGKTLAKEPKENATWFVGKSEEESVHLIYKPDLAFMRSHDACLKEDLAGELKKTRKRGERLIVYAAGSYIGQSDLRKEFHITFCQLPHALKERIDGAKTS